MPNPERKPRAALGHVAAVARVVCPRARRHQLDGRNLGSTLEGDGWGALRGVRQVHGPVPGRSRRLGVVEGEALVVGAFAENGGGGRGFEVRHVRADGGGQHVGVGRGAGAACAGAVGKAEAVHRGFSLPRLVDSGQGVGAGPRVAGHHAVCSSGVGAAVGRTGEKKNETLFYL